MARCHARIRFVYSLAIIFYFSITVYRLAVESYDWSITDGVQKRLYVAYLSNQEQMRPAYIQNCKIIHKQPEDGSKRATVHFETMPGKQGQMYVGL